MTMTKKYFLALSIIMILAVSCMDNPSRPKRSSGGSEDITITLGDGSTVSIPVDTSDYWQDNEKLTEIYSNQMSKTYIYDGVPTGNDGLRYKFADNLDMVGPKDNKIYKKYVKTILVKVNDKDNEQSSASLHGKYVVGAAYEVVNERGNESGYNENDEANQPKVGGYEIIVYNYGRSENNVKVPIDSKERTLHFLLRYNLPNTDANSNYDPEKVFDGTYPKIDDIPAYWFILPEQYKAQ